MGRSPQWHEYATAGCWEPLRPRLVGIFPASRGTETHRRTGAVGPPAYPGVLLVEMARPRGAVAQPAPVGAYGYRVRCGDQWSRRLASGRPAGITPGAEQRRPASTRLSVSIDSCRALTAAGFNRRMRKTVRPVVWEGDGAQSPSLDPIRGPAPLLCRTPTAPLHWRGSVRGAILVVTPGCDP